MSDEEWGPWIEHDGKGCPVKGQVVRIQDRTGNISGPYIAYTVGPKFYAGSPVFDTWVHLPKPPDIVRYQIKKPKGLTMLEGLIQSLPVPTKEVEKM